MAGFSAEGNGSIRETMNTRPRFAASFSERYERIFNLQEFSKHPRLPLAAAAVLLGFLLAFQSGFSSGLGSIRETAPICPSYLQNCESFIFLRSGGSHWSHAAYFSLLFLVLTVAAVGLAKRRYAWTHASLLFLFINKIYFQFITTGDVAIPFEAFHLVPCFLLLFSRQRLPDLRWTWMVLYFLSGVVKLHESWIAGTYFTSLEGGFPLVPLAATPLLTNLVIAFELFGIWFLVSRRRTPRLTVLSFFIVFHIVSILFVGYRYPIFTLPLLLILFADVRGLPAARLSRPARILTALLLAANLAPFAIAGDHKVTFEGSQFAMNMFDGNRQSVSRVTILRRDGTVETRDGGTSAAYERVVPFALWSRLRPLCARDHVERVSWTLDLSMNGGPFRRVVDLADACAAEFSPFARNRWLDPNGPVVGYPRPNHYLSPAQELGPEKPEIFPAPQIEFPPSVRWLQRHVDTISFAFALLAASLFIALLFPGFRDRFGFDLAADDSR